METRKLSFAEDVYALMRELPTGMVTTYGDIAAMSGHPRAARIVGGIAHYGPESLPWHRLVHADGRLAVGFPGGVDVQRQLLEAEGIECDGVALKYFAQVRWRPE